jgi:hypothetical protein
MRFGILVAACVMAAQVAAWSQAPAPPAPDETVTITRAEFDALKAAVEQLQQELHQLKGQPTAPAAPTESAPPAAAEAPPSEVPTPGAAPAPEAPPEQTASGGGRALSLPDISLVVQARGKLSTDGRDGARNRVRLSEAEIGIQGYVYPNVKADAFIAMSPEEDEAAQVEEAYLTFLSLRPGLTGYVGRKHVSFGRTNLQHNHSWLYVRQPLVLRNLVAEESLTGDGLALSYVLPTPHEYFAQLDLGGWTGDGPGESTALPDLVVGPGASFADRFYTARLWASHAFGEHTEVELGGSYAQGQAPGCARTGDDGTAYLSGVDLTCRHYGAGTECLLLRAEQVWHRETMHGADSTATGCYLFANLRRDKYSNWGALYDWSEFPQAPNLHESAFSLIYTRQFSEQYYIRLQGTHGSRPGDGSYEELWLQWVWGVGPHTHNLE